MNGGTLRGVAASTVFWAATAALASSGLRYVDDDAPGGAGDSWATAYRYLQDALADPNATEIRVAGGTYRPDQGVGMTAGDRDAVFVIRAGLDVRGGYRGLAGGGDPNERDLDGFESVLSGDLAGDDDPNFTNVGDNSRHVARTDGLNGARVLDGLSIRGGNADGPGSLGDGRWTGSRCRRARAATLHADRQPR